MSAILIAAGANQNPDVFKTLVKAGALINDRDKNGITPLMFACLGNISEEIIKTLISLGADLKAKDYSGNTAFAYIQHNERLEHSDVANLLKSAALE